MKHLSYKVINLVLVFFLFSTANAQKIDSYVLIMPPIYLGEGGPVYVKPLVNLKDSAQDSFGKAYSNSITNALNNPAIGKKSGVKMFNPWYTTRIYSTTENEAEAKYIISGEYSMATNTSASFKEHVSHETSSSKDPKIPFVFYEYISGTSASVSGKISLYQVSSQQIVKEYPFDQSNSDSKSQYLNVVSSASISTLLEKSEDQAIRQHFLAFSPYFNVFTYSFENIKSDDKEYNKELRKQRKDLKDYADAGQLEKLAIAYIEMLDKNIENTEDLNYNLGMCYEMIGNFTKAKEYYYKSNNSEAKQRIDILTQYKDIYQKLGVEIIEKDFK
jgi:tetratricopeptide (TPR) repeat protein